MKPNISIIGPWLLPGIQWWQEYRSGSLVYIDRDVPWKKQIPRNRTIISGHSSSIILSVPIQGGRNFKGLYSECRICYKEKFNLYFLKCIQTHYGSSPYYHLLKEEFQDILLTHYSKLYQLETALFEWCLFRLKIQRKPLNERPLIFNNDLRNTNWTKEETELQKEKFTTNFKLKAHQVGILHYIFNYGGFPIESYD
jgi:hypothetical protein